MMAGGGPFRDRQIDELRSKNRCRCDRGDQPGPLTDANRCHPCPNPTHARFAPIATRGPRDHDALDELITIRWTQRSRCVEMRTRTLLVELRCYLMGRRYSLINCGAARRGVTARNGPRKIDREPGRT